MFGRHHRDCRHGGWPMEMMGRGRGPWGRHGRGHGPHGWRPGHGPPPPPPWVLEMLGRRAGPERGEVRYLILDVLAAGPGHGYQILQTIEERSGGAYRPSPGTIYPTLQLLEEMELVTVSADGKRKLYTLTEAGRAELEEHRDEVDEAWERFAGHAEWAGQFDFPELARRVKRLFRAVNRGFRRGKLGSSEVGRIKEVIDQAIRAIEAILSGDEPDEPDE